MHETIAGSVFNGNFTPTIYSILRHVLPQKLKFVYVSVLSVNVPVSIDRPDTTNTTTPLEFISLHF